MLLCHGQLNYSCKTVKYDFLGSSTKIVHRLSDCLLLAKKKKFFASMLVCLFVQTVVLGGWKSLKTCRNAKTKIQIFFQNGHHCGHIGHWTKSKI